MRSGLSAAENDLKIARIEISRLGALIEIRPIQPDHNRPYPHPQPVPLTAPVLHPDNPLAHFPVFRRVYSPVNPLAQVYPPHILHVEPQVPDDPLSLDKASYMTLVNSYGNNN